MMRILDANCNRAREALRVIEDYARFVLNDDVICGSLKQLRHDLAAATSAIAADAVLFRDTPGDVGTATKTSDELQREDMTHVVVAAGKRLGEALRTIEEYLKTLDPTAASKIESLRYRFYDLEQRLARTLRWGAARLESLRLYVLITERCCSRPWLEAAEQAILGGADCLQLREKEMDGGELLARARQLVELCHRHNVICIINDRADIAMLSGADGVHVGQGDLPAMEVRKVVGRDKIVGVSTHNLEQAQQAVRDGADYIGIGPMFVSPTKPRDFLPGLEFARQISAANLPISAVAIAGITVANIDDVLATGIRAVAVTASVIGAADIHRAASDLKRRLITVGQTFLSAPPIAPIAPPPVPPTFPPAAAPLELDFHIHRRRLPHWELAGATYFVTMRISSGEFSIPERLKILEHIRSGDNHFYTLLAAVVMPDHAHALIEPLPTFDLSRVMKGMKGVSARLVNEMRQTSDKIWQPESFDRIVRDQRELDEKLGYILDNPVRRELVDDPWEYPALYVKFE